MSAPRVTLADMAEAAQERAEYHDASAAHFASEYPDPVRHAEHMKGAATFHAMARLLRILGTFEARARKFVEALLKEHQHG